MKQLFLILISVVICVSVAAQQNNSSENKAQPLTVVKDANGKTYKVDNMNSIDKNAIESVSVIKNKSACEEFKKYGDVSDGVIYIELKAAQPLTVVKDADGKTYVVKDSNNIDAANIESVSVIKNKSACEEFKKYGDVSEGVIYIELKK